MLPRVITNAVPFVDDERLKRAETTDAVYEIHNNSLVIAIGIETTETGPSKQWGSPTNQPTCYRRHSNEQQ